MVPPPLPLDENQRLESLLTLKILDTLPEERFDRVTQCALRLFNVPVSFISLIDSERQWFKSRQGLSISEIPRSISFCGYTINHHDLFVIPDALQDPRFSDNPLVIGEPFIRFYAGCPLTGTDKHFIGSLAIMDHIPREMKPDDLVFLRNLAYWAQNELTLGEVNRSLAESNHLLKMIVDAEPECINLISANGTVRKINPAGLEMIEADHPDQILGKSIFSIITPKDRSGFKALIEAVFRGESEKLECDIIGFKGTRRSLEILAVPFRDSKDEIIALLAVIRDITERKRNEETIRYLAYYDSLTLLPNRTLFHDRLKQAVLASLRLQKPLALLIMDLNRFKEINDTLGHHKGDLVLKEVGERLRQVVRESDTVARLGGDEFAILLPSLEDNEYAALVAQKILNVLQAPFILDGLAFEVGTSIGIAVCPDHAEEVNRLIQRADVAMYAAKGASMGFVFYSPEQDKHTAHRLALFGDLRYGIEHDELKLHYQPKIDYKTRQINGLEALVRWEHRFRGLVLPDQFISFAEETGLINPLTEWVLNEVLHQSFIWHHMGIEVPIAINLSARNFQNEAFLALVEGLLFKWDVEPRLLGLEITETAIMQDPAQALEILKKLNAMGIKLSIDDFGTGYSSLSYLRKLPVNEIKIDKTFVKDMTTNEDDSVIVRSIIDLGHNLNLKVVAEGVEDHHTWVCLETFHCDMAQGFFMTVPVSAQEITPRLREPSWNFMKGSPESKTSL